MQTINDPILNNGDVLNKSLVISIALESSAPLFCTLLNTIIITIVNTAIIPI